MITAIITYLEYSNSTYENIPISLRGQEKQNTPFDHLTDLKKQKKHIKLPVTMKINGIFEK